MRTWVLGLLVTALFGIAQAPAVESYAPTTLSWTEIFAKAAAARGELKPGAYHRISETNRNAIAVHTEVFENGNDYIEQQREGQFTWAFGSSKGVDWDQNENGTVVVESGFHDAEDPFASALDKPKTQDNSIRVLGLTSTAPVCVVVQVAPREGLNQLRYYDAKSFLLRRVDTTDYSGDSWSYEYDDFKTAFGLTFAQNITYRDKFPENTSHTHVVAFERVAASSAHTGIPASRPFFDLGGRSVVQVPAEFNPSGIIVRVTIQGRGLDFQLDSGAADMVLDSGVARELGLTVTDTHKNTFSGDFTSGRTRVADFSLGELHAHNVALEAFPFSRMVGDKKVVGLLGGDFFATGLVGVNFQKKTLSIMAPAKEAPPAPWVSMPIEIDDMVPRAHAKFNAVEGAFVVDLGADDTMLYPHYFRQFHPDKAGDVMGQVEGVAGKAYDFHQYTFSRFDFGDLAFADANAIVVSGTKFEELDYDGLLGRNVLENFNLIFDYPNRKLYVQSLVP
jgi:Aspartyl protease